MRGPGLLAGIFALPYLEQLITATEQPVTYPLARRGGSRWNSSPYPQLSSPEYFPPNSFISDTLGQCGRGRGIPQQTFIDRPGAYPASAILVQRRTGVFLRKSAQRLQFSRGNSRRWHHALAAPSFPSSSSSPPALW